MRLLLVFISIFQVLPYMAPILPAFPLKPKEETVSVALRANISTVPVLEAGTITQDASYVKIKKALELLPEAAGKLFDRELCTAFSGICESYGLDPYLMLALIEKESSFRPDAYNGECQGLCQISLKWHVGRMERLGCTDLFDPEENLLVAADYLSELAGNSRDITEALMYYNMKRETADMLYAQGEYSDYSLDIQKRAEELKKYAEPL